MNLRKNPTMSPVSTNVILLEFFQSLRNGNITILPKDIYLKSDLFSDPCDSNPCLNNGICVGIGENRYRCDCYSTGFEGENCDVGENGEI